MLFLSYQYQRQRDVYQEPWEYGGGVLILCFAPVRGFRRFVAFFFCSRCAQHGGVGVCPPHVSQVFIAEADDCCLLVERGCTAS